MKDNHITNAYAVALPGGSVQILIYDQKTFDEISIAEEIDNKGGRIKKAVVGVLLSFFSMPRRDRQRQGSLPGLG
jgi:hypothetical protein